MVIILHLYCLSAMTSKNIVWLNPENQLRTLFICTFLRMWQCISNVQWADLMWLPVLKLPKLQAVMLYVINRTCLVSRWCPVTFNENRPVCLLIFFCPRFFSESSHSTLVSYVSYLRFIVGTLGNVSDGLIFDWPCTISIYNKENKQLDATIGSLLKFQC